MIKMLTIAVAVVLLNANTTSRPYKIADPVDLGEDFKPNEKIVTIDSYFSPDIQLVKSGTEATCYLVSNEPDSVMASISWSFTRFQVKHDNKNDEVPNPTENQVPWFRDDRPTIVQELKRKPTNNKRLKNQKTADREIQPNNWSTVY